MVLKSGILTCLPIRSVWPNFSSSLILAMRRIACSGKLISRALPFNNLYRLLHSWFYHVWLGPFHRNSDVGRRHCYIIHHTAAVSQITTQTSVLLIIGIELLMGNKLLLRMLSIAMMIERWFLYPLINRSLRSFLRNMLGGVILNLIQKTSMILVASIRSLYGFS